MSGWLIVGAAGATPLRLTDVELMLRTGWSSADTLREVAQRRVTGQLDRYTENQLRSEGAQLDLIEALRSGRYTLDPEETRQAEAERARQRQAEERERQITKSRDAGWRAANARPAPGSSRPALGGPGAPGPAAVGPVSGAVGSVLRDLGPVRLRTGTLEPADTTSYPQKRFFLFLSAGRWQRSGREFVPRLVDFYQRFAPAHPEFELFFVSRDRNEPDMKADMEENRMPWPALPYAAAQLPPRPLPRLPGGSAPSLVLTDSSGRVLAQSVGGTRQADPGRVIQELERWVFLTEHPPAGQVPRVAGRAP